MKNLNHLDEHRITIAGMKGDEYCGAFEMKLKGSRLTFRVVASNGFGWDHVSVSTTERCPKWDEMAQVKELFFEDDEVVMQLHPAKADHINMHPYCLHLWRPHGTTIPLPPKEMVGW